MNGRSTWTDCGEAGDYVLPNVTSTRDVVSRPDNMDETVPHTHEVSSPFIWSETVLISSFCTTLKRCLVRGIAYMFKRLKC